jgi:hypothetical protein
VDFMQAAVIGQELAAHSAEEQHLVPLPCFAWGISNSFSFYL